MAMARREDLCVAKPAGGQGALAVTLLFAAFIAATYAFGLYLFPMLVTEMRRDLGFDYGTVGWMTAGGQVGFLVFALLSGLLAQWLGAARMILGSVLICALALGVMTFASGPIGVGLLLTLLGAMAASVWVPMVEVAQARIPERHQGKALGLISSGTSYGVFLNGLAVPPLLAWQDWRAVWLAAGLLALALFLLALPALRREPRAAAVSGAERKPLLERLAGLCSPRAAAIWLMMLLNGLACIPFQTYLTAFVREELGLSIGAAGMLWSMIGLVGMGSGVAIGALADRITINGAMLLTYGLLLIAGGGLWLHPSTAMLFLAAAAFGLSFYAIFGLLPAYISLMFPAGAATLIFGIGNVTLGLGGMAGNMVGGWLREDLGSFEPTYLMVMLAAAASIVLTFALPRTHSRRKPAPA